MYLVKINDQSRNSSANSWSSVAKQQQYAGNDKNRPQVRNSNQFSLRCKAHDKLEPAICMITSSFYRLVLPCNNTSRFLTHIPYISPKPKMLAIPEYALRQGKKYSNNQVSLQPRSPVTFALDANHHGDVCI